MNKETIKVSREEADSLPIPVLRKMFGIIETGEYSIERLTDYAYRCYTKMNLFIYILMFIPFHIFEIFLCIWECGFREFGLVDREIDQYTVFKHDVQFENVDKLYKTHKESGREKYEQKTCEYSEDLEG